jgi:glycerol-3-phosphate acyltransferase PlsX
MRIGIDVMGGDFVPQAPIAGACLALSQIQSDTRLVLIGDETVIRAEMNRQNISADAFDVVHTSEVIGMDEHPARAFTQKTDSSIHKGIRLHREQQLDAFISAGNTGAMLVGSVLGLGNIEGVLRPTIGALYPCNGSYSLVCDVGANADCKPEYLAQFALLGSIYMKEVLGVAQPRVALLNVGEERTKGSQLALATYELLDKHTGINFIGNAEGRDLNSGKADVYVCDGYTGNIVLKFAESFYDLFHARFPEDELVKSFNFENYGGLPVLGVKGVSIIGHGISTPRAFVSMVRTAEDVVNSKLTAKIENAIKEFVQPS